MRYILATTLLVTLAACSQADSPAPEDAPGVGVATSSGSAPVAATQSANTANSIRIEPSSLPDCTPVEANVIWSVSNPTGETFEVHVGDRGGDLFAAGGAMGESRTGRWAVPGTTFVLTEAASGDEVGRASIQGPSCS